jgi:hypothetical protein
MLPTPNTIAWLGLLLLPLLPLHPPSCVLLSCAELLLWYPLLLLSCAVLLWCWLAALNQPVASTCCSSSSCSKGQHSMH